MINSPDELILGYHDDGTPIKLLTRREIHEKGILHHTVHLWIINPHNELLLQKRSLSKDTFPGLWDISAAGHIEGHDSAIDSVIREAHEELGLPLNRENITLIGTVNNLTRHPNSKIIDQEQSFVYLTICSWPIEKFCFEQKEIDSLRFLRWDKFQREIECKKPQFVPHQEEYQLLFRFLKNEKNL
mgnify:CR=1 FL=1